MAASIAAISIIGVSAAYQRKAASADISMSKASAMAKAASKENDNQSSGGSEKA